MRNTTYQDRAQPLGKYPHIKQVGNFYFVSGTSSRRADNTHIGAKQDADGNWQLDIRAQTQAVLDNIEAILQGVGLDRTDIVDITTFLVDMKDFPGYNEVYANFFTQDSPARTTVAVHQLPHPNLLIEIKATAYRAETQDE